VLRPVSSKTFEWYFAYGSNLDRRTFCGRYRMNRRDACRGRLVDFALRFDLPVGASNLGVADLVVEHGSAAWGMVYQIRRSEARRLDRSEGVHRGFYR
jgi:cation transport regulator ChaC